jgi:hypothetical protein
MNLTQPKPETLADKADRLNRAISPVVAGMIIDGVDLATFGPIGLALGLPIGGLAGYWLGKSLGLEKQACLLCALAAGVYCTIPFTAILPLATLVGAYARYRQTEREQRRAEPPCHYDVLESNSEVRRGIYFEPRLITSQDRQRDVSE